MTLLEFITTLLLAVCTYATAPEDIQHNLYEQVKPAMLIRMAAIEYSSWMIATAAHEYGHAALAEKLTGAPAHIHLGTPCADTTRSPWLQCGKFQLDGFNPKAGYTHYSTINEAALRTNMQQYVASNINLDKKSTKNIQELLNSDVFAALAHQARLTQDERHKILLIGGLCGTVARIAMRTLTEGSIRPDYIMVHELFNSLLPLSPGSDAYIIWQERFQLTTQELDIILHITTLLDMSACVYFTITDTRNAPHAPLHTKAMLGLINYFLSGYARFYAGSSQASTVQA